MIDKGHRFYYNKNHVTMTNWRGLHMSRTSQLITDKLAYLAEQSLKELGRSGAIARKLQAISSANKHGIKKVAEVYNISRTTLTHWIRSFKDGSLVALNPKPKKPRSPIRAEHRIIIKEWLEQESRMTIEELRLKIENQLNIKLGKSAVHNLMKNIGFSYITPRPKHYKQDSSKQEEFKKKSSTASEGKSPGI